MALHSLQIGQRVRFSVASRLGGRVSHEGVIMRWRKDRGGAQGWLDVRCADGIERSVRPNGAEAI